MAEGQKVFTYDDLRGFDGKGGDGKIYVGLCGKVFDVTEKGKQFYGAGKLPNNLTFLYIYEHSVIRRRRIEAYDVSGLLSGLPMQALRNCPSVCNHV